jgi:hypothetical protein
MEVIHPRDGDAVTLGACPPWCTASRHFAPGAVIDSDDGYHHYGPQAEVATSDPLVGLPGDPETIVRVTLKSWTHPLGAAPGPARIEVNLGTAQVSTDMCAELTPGEARAVAAALLELAATAEHQP